MADSLIIQTTLLYDAVPDLPEDSLRTDLRVIASKHGLPVSGTSDVRDGQLRLSCLPFEIVVDVQAAALCASNFTGAISANLRPGQRAPLARIVNDHAAHVKVSVRDTGESHGVREVMTEDGSTERANLRRATVFAQDVVRMVLRHMPATALHWHPSNQLALPGGLQGQDFGQLFLPLCLRLRCTSAVLPGTEVVNMAQEVIGAEDFLGKPLHVMALSLNRFETMQLAVAFLDRMLMGESRPISGAIFRDQRGNRVQVVEHQCEKRAAGGMIALVEVDSKHRATGAALSSAVAGARSQVAERTATRSRPLLQSERVKSERLVLNEAQLAAVNKGIGSGQPDFVRPPDTVAEEVDQPLPTADELRAMRERMLRGG